MCPSSSIIFSAVISYPNSCNFSLTKFSPTLGCKIRFGLLANFSFPFSSIGILNLAFPSYSTCISLSLKCILSTIYLASPFNISSIIISLASYNPVFFNLTLYLFLSPASIILLSTVFSISKFVSFTVPFTL